MTNTKFITLFLLITVFSSSTCKKDNNCPNDSHQVFYLKNNSNTAINWVNGERPRDTIFFDQGISARDASFSLILPNSSFSVGAGLQGCWENKYAHDSTEVYFIFSHDTVQNIGWQAINGTNRGLLKRIEVNLDYLEDNNFIVAYP